MLRPDLSVIFVKERVSGNFDLLHNLIDSTEGSVAIDANGTYSHYLHPNHRYSLSDVTINSF